MKRFSILIAVLAVFLMTVAPASAVKPPADSQNLIIVQDGDVLVHEYVFVKSTSTKGFDLSKTSYVTNDLNWGIDEKLGAPQQNAVKVEGRPYYRLAGMEATFCNVLQLKNDAEVFNQSNVVWLDLASFVGYDEDIVWRDEVDPYSNDHKLCIYALSENNQ